MSRGLHEDFYSVLDHVVYVWDAAAAPEDLDEPDPYAEDAHTNFLAIPVGADGQTVVRVRLLAMDEDEPRGVGTPLEHPSRPVLRLTNGTLAIGVPWELLRTPDGVFETETTIMKLNTGGGDLPLRLWWLEARATLHIGVSGAVQIEKVLQHIPVPSRDRSVDLAGHYLPPNAIPMADYLSGPTIGPISSLVVEHSDGRRQQSDPFMIRWKQKLAAYQGEDIESADFPWRVTHVVVAPSAEEPSTDGPSSERSDARRSRSITRSDSNAWLAVEAIDGHADPWRAIVESLGFEPVRIDVREIASVHQYLRRLSTELGLDPRGHPNQSWDAFISTLAARGAELHRRPTAVLLDGWHDLGVARPELARELLSYDDALVGTDGYYWFRR